MSLPLNPMNLSGPPSNYQQPNTTKPASNAAVATYDVGANMLNLVWPLAVYTQPNYATTPTPPAPAFPLSGSPRFVTLQ